MAANLEIKASLPDKDLAIARAGQLGAVYAGVLHQTDVYFRTEKGRLKLRTINGSGAELIFYERAEVANERLSRFERYPAADPEHLRDLLGSAYGIRGVVEKERMLWMVGQTRIHIDEVRSLGCFLEIEVPVADDVEQATESMRKLLEGFQIAPGAFLRASYIDLLAQQG